MLHFKTKNIKEAPEVQKKSAYGIRARRFRVIFTCLAILTVVCSIYSCTKTPEWKKISGPAWGTFYNITYQSDKELDDSVKAALKSIDMEFSMFNPSSAVSKINAGDTDSLTIGIAEMIKQAKEVNRLSGGVYDPTVAPLVDLWGFGRKEQPEGYEPSQEEIDSARLRVGIAECEVSENMIFKPKSRGTWLDFSSIAKGYGVDKIGEMLKRNGVENFLIEVGGEIVSSGQSPRGTDWMILIDAPTEELEGQINHENLLTIPTSGQGIATSGNYRNHRKAGDKVVGHIISPITGRPIQTDVLSATVIAPTCALADALASACMAMPSPQALEMIKKVVDAEVLLVVKEGEGMVIKSSAGFPAESSI